MAVQSPPSSPITSSPAGSLHGDVIEEARARQQRHRRLGACLAVALAALILFLDIGGGGGTTRSAAPVAEDGAGSVQGAILRLVRGRLTTTFTVKAPAEHAYDVTVTAPTASAIFLTMKITPAERWTLNTRDGQVCQRHRQQTGCLLHFAAGGNPGGTWTGIVRKSSVLTARVRISVVFARHAGEFGG